MASGTFLSFFLVMKWSVWLSLATSTVKYFSSENNKIGDLIFNMKRSFSGRSILRAFGWYVKRNFLFLANDLAPMFFLTTFLTVASDTLRSFAILFIGLMGFLLIRLLMALTSLGVTTTASFLALVYV